MRSLTTWLDAVERLPGAGAVLTALERKFYLRHIRRVRLTAGARASAATGGVIATGLFAGMRLGDRASWGQDHYAVITGQYERELAGILGRACALAYSCFVDIGCANGFYAVGLACAARDRPVFAFDIDPRAREVTQANARLNGVADRVQVGGAIGVDALAALVKAQVPAFILSDVEGAELDLLDPAGRPALLEGDLLVELHGDMPAAIATFRQRFAATHQLHLIGRLPRSPYDDDHGGFALEDDAWIAVSEGRGFVRHNWLFMVRHAQAGSYRDVLEAPHIRRA